MSEYAKSVTVIQFMSWPKQQRVDFVNTHMQNALPAVKQALLAA